MSLVEEAVVARCSARRVLTTRRVAGDQPSSTSSSSESLNSNKYAGATNATTQSSQSLNESTPPVASPAAAAAQRPSQTYSTYSPTPGAPCWVHSTSLSSYYGQRFNQAWAMTRKKKKLMLSHVVCVQRIRTSCLHDLLPVLQWLAGDPPAAEAAAARQVSNPQASAAPTIRIAWTRTTLREYYWRCWKK